jgi:hypothetical protein
MKDMTKCELSDEHRDNNTLAVRPNWRAMKVAGAPLVYDVYLNTREAIQICERFRSILFEPGGQVMWTGVPREWA